MKRFLAAVLTVITALMASGESKTFTIDVTKEVNAREYEYIYAEKGMPYINYTISFENSKRIKGINYKAVNRIGSENFEMKSGNSDISTSCTSKTLEEKSPAEHIVMQGCGNMAKSTHLFLRVFPFIEREDGIEGATVFEVEVEYTDEGSNTLSSPFDKMFRETGGKRIFSADNKAASMEEQSSLDLVIITDSSFVREMDDIVLTERVLGLRTEIYTTSYIYENYRGTDRQEKIRNFVKFMYQSRGIRFLLLGGDTKIVPARICYSGLYYYQGYLPSDLYYSDIDGDWNKNGNGLIGELSDDIEDGYPDIAVSRLPFADSNELENIKDKIHGYLFENNSEKIKGFLLAGASLTASLTDGTGQIYSEGIRELDESGFYNYKRVYSPMNDTFNTYPLYCADKQLNSSIFASEISNGYHFANHIDHSNEFWLGTGNIETKTELSTIDSTKLSCSGTYTIMFSLGCSPNAYDAECVSEMLINSAKSPVVNFTGFVRTGWTSAKNLEERFWAKMESPDSRYAGEALIYALADDNMYFKAAVNMVGIASMPVFKRDVRRISAFYEDTIQNTEYFEIDVLVNGAAEESVAVSIISGGEHRIYKTDKKGHAEMSGFPSDSIIVLGISASDAAPLIDTIYVKNFRNVTFKDLFFTDCSKSFIKIKIENNTSENLEAGSIAATASDSLLKIDAAVSTSALNAYAYEYIEIPVLSYASPLVDCCRKIYIKYSSGGVVISDSAVINLLSNRIEAEGFLATIGTTCTQGIISGISIVNSGAEAEQVVVKVKSMNSSVTIADSICTISSIGCGESVSLPEMHAAIIGGDTADFKNSLFALTVSAYGREVTDTFTGTPDTTEFTVLNAYLTADGIRLYHTSEDYGAEIYSSDSYNGNYELRAELEPGSSTFLDTLYSSEQTFYYAVYYDNAGRYVKQSDTVRVYSYMKTKLSKVQLSGGFYGTLDGVKYYSKSSFNAADLNNDGKKELIVIGDDGAVKILNSKMEDVTPFEIMVGAHAETSPAVGDIDNNGYADIVLANGFSSSDTSFAVIMNLFSDNPEILYGTGVGALYASPVIANVNDDPYSEILIGSQKGMNVFDRNLNRIDALSRTTANVTGIAVAEDKKRIVYADYYGNIYMEKFSGENAANFPVRLGQVTVAPLVMGDIDFNSTMDIVIGTASGKVYVVDEYGKIRNNFPYTASSGIYQSPRIANFDNDNSYEIVIMDYNGSVYKISANGNLLARYDTGDKYNTFNEPLIYDIDSDMKAEVVFSTKSGKIYVLDKDLRSNVFEYVLDLGTSVTSSPMMVDFTGNGLFSMIVKTNNGNIYKCEYTEAFASNGNSIASASVAVLFEKTLFNERNTSYVSNTLLEKNETYVLGEALKKESFVRISKSVVRNRVEIVYSLNDGRDESDMYVYNNNGAVVDVIKIFKGEGRINYAGFMNLPSGEYFISADMNGNKQVSKILSLK